MRRCFVFLLIFVSAFVSVSAQIKRPFTFDDMMKLKRVGTPRVSPDGKWVLFSAVDVDLAANTKTSHVWIVPVLGGQERQIIADQDGDSPRWAPDGKRFVFVSTKGDSQQLWTADFNRATGDATGLRKLTSIATEADGPVWSPDGKNIAFVSSVYPECDGNAVEEAACNVKKLEDVKNSKVKAQVFTRLLYRHWNAYQEGKRSHIFIVSAEGGTPVDLTPGDFDSPVFSLGGQDLYAFSPDGQELCYTSNHDLVEATSTNNDLWVVPVGGGPAKNITAENKASDSTPQYSPDGKYIAYRAQARSGFEADRFRLVLYNRKTGRTRNLTESFDRWVGAYAWDPDSSKIYFAAEDKGNSPVFSVALEDAVIDAGTGTEASMRVAKAKITTLVPGYNDDIAVTHDGKFLIGSRMSIKAPNEIFRFPLPRSESGKPVFDTQEVCKDANGNITPKGCRPTPEQQEAQLTNVNRAVLAQVQMSPIEPFTFPGAENTQVQGFLVRPPGFAPNQKYPVKFLVHGGPQGGWGDDWSFRWNAELFAADGYVVVMINPRGSTGYGQKFIDEISGDWGGRVFEDLMKGLDYVEQRYPFIDKERECALGASYGGYMMNWILGHSNRFKCLVSHDGMFNSESAWGTTEELWFNEWEFKGTPYTDRAIYQKWSPHQYSANFKTPTLVVHGQKDYRLDVSEGFQLFTTLQRLNVPSKMLYFPDEGHWVLKPQNSQLWYKTVNEWVDQWLKK